jgi:hypothetical protein
MDCIDVAQDKDQSRRALVNTIINFEFHIAGRFLGLHN